MRIRMARTLSVGCVLACASIPAAAQVNPQATQLPQSSEKTLPATKPSESATDSGKIRVRLYSDPQDAQGDIQQKLSWLQQVQADGAADAPPSCAHILIYAAQSSDTAM